MSAIGIDDVRVRAFGETAVVTGRTHGRGEYGGVPYDVTIRFTDVFVHRAGRWQAVASQATLLTAGD
jgi:ketosteroid isomerase-like protein